MSRAVVIVVVSAITLALGYPLAACLQHGLEPAFWPPQVVQPAEWLAAFSSLHWQTIAEAYWRIAVGTSAAFSNGGWSWPAISAFFPLIVTLAAPGVRHLIQRDESNVFGSARFANDAERASMKRGLELGVDPKTGRPIRIQVQGTLVTIAPPRKGKTSAFVVPNLAYPELSAWNGPAVVIDPKGEAFRAVAKRRRAMGRRVICLDPLGLVGGKDKWNPLIGRNPSDVLYFQNATLALLPESTKSDDASRYFRDLAADLIVGAMLVALSADEPSIVEVQRLLNNDDQFIAGLKRLLEQRPEPIAESALSVLQADPKTRDPIKTTASQAFRWLGDQRMQRAVKTSTFQLSDLCAGNVDLFVALPIEYKKILAPFMRWLLSDLFMAARRNRVAERIVVFIDEAAALGRFDEILDAAGELPGHGVSLWTFWQYRSQIVANYGEADASTILDTAEVVTISDVSAANPEESQRWSDAIGQYTAMVETSSQSREPKANATVSRAPHAASLLTKEALVAMPADELLVLLNSAKHARFPIVLKKTVAHEDPRFKKLIEHFKPVGPSQ